VNKKKKNQKNSKYEIHELDSTTQPRLDFSVGSSTINHSINNIKINNLFSNDENNLENRVTSVEQEEN
jgi:hypothetical protein